MEKKNKQLLHKILKSKHIGKLVSSFSCALPFPSYLCICAIDEVFISAGNTNEEFQTLRFPLFFNGKEWAELILKCADKDTKIAPNLATVLITSIQAVIDYEYEKRAVSSETINVYRELALLQRATEKMSNKLDTIQIGRILLDESGINLASGSGGSVFSYCLRENEFKHLASTDERFQIIAEQVIKQKTLNTFKEITSIQIISDFENSHLCDEHLKNYKSIMVVPFVDSGKYLGLMILMSPVREFFLSSDRKRLEMLGTVASSALHNALMFEEQKELFNSFLNTIALAVDSKSVYTAGHCKRVPWIVRELLLAAAESDSEPFKSFNITEEELEEVNVAALLHDCGKIATPEWIMDKATKLQGIVDGIDIIRLKVDILKLQIMLADYKKHHNEHTYSQETLNKLKQAESDFEFLKSLNIGGEFLSSDIADRLAELGKTPLGHQGRLLTDDEVEKLSITRGTLTAGERRIIEEHSLKTVALLERIRFPENMKNVVLYAGNHHEKLNGSGYPYRKKEQELCIKSRILVIADIFEALTAEDRPYKASRPISEALKIMELMVKSNEIDGDLVKLMLDQDIHRRYATEFLPDYLIDL